MLSGDGHSFQVDVWAVGVLLYAMLMGKPPFETSNMKTTYNKIQSIMYTFPAEISISLSSKILIQKILTRNPSKRPTLEELIESDFFIENGSFSPEGIKSLQSGNDTDHLNASPEHKPAPPTTPMHIGGGRKDLKEVSSEGNKDMKKAIIKKIIEEDPILPEKTDKSPLERQLFYKKLMNNEFKDSKTGLSSTPKNIDLPLVAGSAVDRKSIPLAAQFSSGSRFEKKAIDKEKEKEKERELIGTKKEIVPKDQREINIKESKELKEFRERREQRDKEQKARDTAVAQGKEKIETPRLAVTESMKSLNFSAKPKESTKLVL